MDSTDHISEQHITDLPPRDGMAAQPTATQPVVDATPIVPPAPVIDAEPIEADPTAAAAGGRPSVESLRVAASSIREDIGKKLNDPTAVYVALGASDLVAERARQAAVTAARQGAEFAEKARAWNTQVSSEASDVPRLALSRALRVAGHVEAAYSDLASRGREVADRVRDGRGGSDLVRRAVVTLSRGRSEAASAGPGTVVLGETVETAQVVDPIGVVDPIDVVDPFGVADPFGVVDPSDVVDPIEVVDPMNIGYPMDITDPVATVGTMDDDVTDNDLSGLDPVELVDSGTEPVEVLDPMAPMDSIGGADQIDTVDLIEAAERPDDEASGADPTRADVVTGGDPVDPADSDEADRSSH